MAYIPRVSIVILNWNGGKYLKDCLDSVLKTDYHDLEVIVVDNASTDGSQELVKKHYPQVILIENEKNLGFCVGNNIGIERATGDIIVLLNNDTLVDKNWIKEIVEEAKDSSVGIIGCKLYYPNSRIIQSFGFCMKFLGYWESIGAGQEDNGQFNVPRDVEYVSGAAMAIKREVLEKVGLLDPEFYAYGEDIDICIRARKAGYRIVTSNAIVYHYGSLSWNSFLIKKMYLNNRNCLYFILKHYGPNILAKFIIAYPILSFKTGVCRFLRGETVLQKLAYSKTKTQQKSHVPLVAFTTIILRNITFLIALFSYLLKKFSNKR